MAIIVVAMTIVVAIQGNPICKYASVQFNCFSFNCPNNYKEYYKLEIPCEYVEGKIKALD